MDPQPSPPQHDDQRAQPTPVNAMSGGRHDGHDLGDCRRISRIALAPVARRAARVESGHRRRRTATAGPHVPACGGLKRGCCPVHGRAPCPQPRPRSSRRAGRHALRAVLAARGHHGGHREGRRPTADGGLPPAARTQRGRPCPRGRRTLATSLRDPAAARLPHSRRLAAPRLARPSPTCRSLTHSTFLRRSSWAPRKADG